MTLADLLPIFAQTGVFGVLAWVGYRLHLDAVRTHEQRAADWKIARDDWKAAYENERIRADEVSRQLAHVLSAVKETTAGAV